MIIIFFEKYKKTNFNKHLKPGLKVSEVEINGKKISAISVKYTGSDVLIGNSMEALIMLIV